MSPHNISVRHKDGYGINDEIADKNAPLVTEARSSPIAKRSATSNGKFSDASESLRMSNHVNLGSSGISTEHGPLPNKPIKQSSKNTPVHSKRKAERIKVLDMINGESYDNEIVQEVSTPWIKVARAKQNRQVDSTKHITLKQSVNRNTSNNNSLGTSEQVKVLVQKAVKACHDGHASSIARHLRVARLRPKSSHSKHTAQPQSPFRNLPSLPTMAHSQNSQPRITGFTRHTSNLQMVGFSLPVEHTSFKSDSISIPAYTYSTELEQRMLACNVRELAILPHMEPEPDGLSEDVNEQYYVEDLQKHFNNNLCQQKAKKYFPHLQNCFDDQMMDDMAFWLANSSFDSRIKVVAGSSVFSRSHTLETKERLKAKLKLLQLNGPSEAPPEALWTICKELLENAGVSFWEVIELHLEAKFATMQAKDTNRDLEFYENLLCRICFAFDCPHHGEVVDSDLSDSGNSDADSVSRSSSRSQVDRVHVSSQSNSVPNMRPDHFALELPWSELRGMNDDGTISGSPWIQKDGLDGPKNEEDEMDLPHLDDDILCSEECFWKKSNRGDEKRILDESEANLITGLLQMYGANQRAACSIAVVIQRPCVLIFSKLLTHFRNVNSIHSPKITRVSGHSRRRGPPRGDWASHNWRPELRSSFMPCDHEGPCNASNCSCAAQGIWCEKICGCSNTCALRFQGCDCGRRGKPCTHADCDCWNTNRECDPDLCSSCGAHILLNQRNIDQLSVEHELCGNVALQLGVEPRTLLGTSQVAGFGLFAGEQIRLGQLIGEYKGELISLGESFRRGSVYHYRPAQYLFQLSQTQELDATHMGNKTRYINHSGNEANINCQAKVKFCNTVIREGLFATRNIAPGEELFFNYRLGADKTSGFTEIGPAETPAIMNASLRSKSSRDAFAATRRMRVGDDTDEDEMNSTHSVQETDTNQPAATSGLIVSDSDDASYVDENDEQPRRRSARGRLLQRSPRLETNNRKRKWPSRSDAKFA